MGRYKPEVPDLVEYIKQLEKRISVLERTPQLGNAALDDGMVVVYSGKGEIRFIHNDGTTHMLRIGLWDTFFGPVDLYQLNYLDGNPMFKAQSNLFGFENWWFQDSSDNIILGVDAKDPFAHGEGVGLARPFIPQPVFPIANPTDTTASGTFTTLNRGVWRKQHPAGEFWVQYNVTSTTGEVQVLVGSDVVVGPVVLNNGTGIVNIGRAVMPGSHMDAYTVDYQGRVASGAGSVGIRVQAFGRER